jgi:hypothetical protein
MHSSTARARTSSASPFGFGSVSGGTGAVGSKRRSAVSSSSMVAIRDALGAWSTLPAFTVKTSPGLATMVRMSARSFGQTTLELRGSRASERMSK